MVRDIEGGHYSTRTFRVGTIVRTLLHKDTRTHRRQHSYSNILVACKLASLQATNPYAITIPRTDYLRCACHCCYDGGEGGGGGGGGGGGKELIERGEGSR